MGLGVGQSNFSPPTATSSPSTYRSSAVDFWWVLESAVGDRKVPWLGQMSSPNLEFQPGGWIQMTNSTTVLHSRNFFSLPPCQQQSLNHLQNCCWQSGVAKARLVATRERTCSVVASWPIGLCQCTFSRWVKTYLFWWESQPFWLCGPLCLFLFIVYFI